MVTALESAFKRETAAGETMRHAVAITVELQSHVFVNQHLDGVAIIRRDDRQTAEGIGLETIDWAFSRFAVQSPVGDLIEPFTRLAIHIVEVEEIAQRPEVLTDVTDAGAFHFPLLPSARLIAGARVEVEFTGKGQEARIEADQSTIMFGNGGGQVVIPDLPGDAVHLLKCVNVTTDKGLETLAVRELQILHPAVPVNQGEGVEFPLIALVVERVEVPPVGLEAFARLGFHAHESSLRLQLRAYFVHVLAQNAAATVVAQWLDPLSYHGGAGGRVLFEQLCDGGFIRIEFAGAGPSRGSLSRHVQILLDRVPAHVQVALDLADRPMLGPVQAMQVVDLFGRQHGLDPHLYAQGVAGTRAMFFTRFRREGDNPLKDHDFGESYVVLYKIGRIGPNQPNLCGGML